MPVGTRPTVGAFSVTFTLADPATKYTAVRLWQEVRIPGDRLDFTRVGDCWRLTVDRPPVHRMEYLYDVSDHAGGRKMIVDPANPQHVNGAFGEHSVVDLPGYQRPAWLDAPAVDGQWSALSVPSRPLKAEVEVAVWSPVGTTAGTAMPLLVANDGPEYDALSRLSQYCAAGIAGRALPPMRLALLAPGDRDQWYSCSSAYASALATAVLPALRRSVVTLGRPVGMGTSLGALAMLHTQRRYPATFAGLFLQSGSFFTPLYDRHEVRFCRYLRVVRFVGDTLRAESARESLPVAMTCGVIEENIDNNRLMAAALSGQSYQVRLAEVPDMHNYTAWRDAFDPHLTNLLTHLWRAT